MYLLRDSHTFENSIRATISDRDLRRESGSLRPRSCQKAVFRRLCVTVPAAASRPPRRGRLWPYRPHILRLGWLSACAAARLHRPRSIGHSPMPCSEPPGFHLSAPPTDFGALFTPRQRLAVKGRSALSRAICLLWHGSRGKPSVFGREGPQKSSIPSTGITEQKGLSNIYGKNA